MAAFEISINGNSLKTMDGGDFGALSANITWIRGQQKSGIITQRAHLMRIAHSLDHDVASWPTVELHVGDEITIRIVDPQLPTPPDAAKLFSI